MWSDVVCCYHTLTSVFTTTVPTRCLVQYHWRPLLLFLIACYARPCAWQVRTNTNTPSWSTSASTPHSLDLIATFTFQPTNQPTKQSTWLTHSLSLTHLSRSYHPLSAAFDCRHNAMVWCMLCYVCACISWLIGGGLQWVDFHLLMLTPLHLPMSLAGLHGWR